MGINHTSEVSNLLVNYWTSQGIIPGKEFRPNEFDKVLSKLFSFKEFLSIYSLANGMDNKYPDEYDNKGFLFYPAESIKPFPEDNGVLILGDYLNKCWWYGVRLLSEDSYEIIIVEGKNSYTFISNSIVEFIFMYINDNEKIYPMYDI